MADDGYVKARPIEASELQWGYGGSQYAPRRRVSVVPHVMLIGVIYASLEARGVLMTIFCRYWRLDKGVLAEHVRLEHRLSRPKFKRLIDELAGLGLVKRTGVTLAPAGAFGPSPDGLLAGNKRSDRDMPPDWIELRDAVFARDRFACVYCGSGRDLHCDHVHPVALGGSHDIGNLATACASCNLSKGSKTLAEWRPEIAARWTGE